MLDIFQKWKDKISGLVENKVRLVQLELIERTSSIMSYFIFAIILMFIIFGSILFLGLGLAEWFTMLFDNRVGGFLMAGGCYVILALLLMAIRRPILALLGNVFIRLITERKKDVRNVKPESGDDDDE